MRVAKEREFGLAKGADVVQDELPFYSHEDLPMPAQTLNAPALDGVLLRPMTAADLPLAHALTAELRWRWGERHATIGLVIVSPACQGRRLGHRLMSALLEGLDAHTVLLHATAEGRGLYERLGFVRTGELRQHQGIAQPAPLIALQPGWRLRPAGVQEAPALQALDAAARGMPRDALIADLLAASEACVVLDHDNAPRGFAMLRRFGRGHAIGPVVAPDAEGAKALIAHLAGTNAGNFTRIDIDFASGLAEWLESFGLLRVDAPTTMVRGTPLATPPGGPSLFAIVTQAVG